MTVSALSPLHTALAFSARKKTSKTKTETASKPRTLKPRQSMSSPPKAKTFRTGGLNFFPIPKDRYQIFEPFLNVHASLVNLIGGRTGQEDRAGVLLTRGFSKSELDTKLNTAWQQLDAGTRGNDSGATLTLAALTPDNQLLLRHVGDSQFHLGVLGHDGSTGLRQVSHSHTPDLPSEKARLLRTHPKLLTGNGRLHSDKKTTDIAVSRSFGDSAFSAVISTPQRKHFDLNPAFQAGDSIFGISLTDGGLPRSGYTDKDFSDALRELMPQMLVPSRPHTKPRVEVKLNPAAIIDRIPRSTEQRDNRTIQTLVLPADVMLKPRKETLVWYVADGHGGETTVNYIASRLPELMA